jgi:hypothetical protein
MRLIWFSRLQVNLLTHERKSRLESVIPCNFITQN